MKQVVELLVVNKTIATVRDLDTEEETQVPISKEESRVYAAMLDEVKEDAALTNEPTGVIAFIDSETKTFLFPEDESELF